ncbi:hypothetical protein [Streptomyces sp. SBT349]|uniref:hypothetical protein n=1 Tax=Streptomyces sp. SBT349 TaxID=1580539 RepID=UPI000B289BBB|nr:hypothetical protein [Streptomyces sp. SBT349]
MSHLPRRFHLQRTVDITGASGVGTVADGVQWADGRVTIRWRSAHPSTVQWDRLEDALAVHGHGGHTTIVWDDPEGEPLPDLYLGSPGCPHCPDGHTPPEHGQPWGAYLGSERDGDGQPIRIYVERSAGAHVAESDAEWVRHRLNQP